MSDIETARQNALSDSNQFGSRKRFGLFSQPISNAVGDDGQYKKKLHPRDPATNKPMTQPRNFYTSPIKSGQGNNGYFTAFTSLATSNVKDQYIQPGKRLQKQQFETRNKGKKHQVSFFTGAGNKVLNKPSYPYIEQKNPELDAKRHRDADGRVKSQPRNFYTNQISTVETSFFKQYKHMPDPYNRVKQLQKQRNKKNKSLEGQQSFKPNSFSPKSFNDIKKTYGEDVQLKEKQPKQTKINIYKHEMPWKSSNPNKKGIYGYLAPFPQYKQNPPKQLKRKDAQEKVRQNFKLNSSQILTSPSPSISLNRSNLVRSMKKY